MIEHKITAKVSNTPCSCCLTGTLTPFISFDNAPVFCNILLSSATEARNIPRGNISLSLCDSCGCIVNTEFDTNTLDYSGEYDNSLFFSPTFGEYAKELAKDLLKRHNLHDKTVIEIGCGDGQFLNQVCQLGNCNGFGFEPSAKSRYHLEGNNSVQIIPTEFTSDSWPGHCDLVICRHVLEHIANPKSWLQSIREGMITNPDASIYIEVPNSFFILKDLSIWDIIYEHYSYFVPESLALLMQTSGFEVIRHGASYFGQFAFVEAKIAQNVNQQIPLNMPDFSELKTLCSSFEREFTRILSDWNSKLTKLTCSGTLPVAWGAGSKGVMFLNLLGSAYTHTSIVDISPRKTGKYVPGSAQQIVTPSDIPKNSSTQILLMNAAYKNEVSLMLNNLGIKANLTTI